MSRMRIAAGAAGVLMALGLATGVAGAQTGPGTDKSGVLDNSTSTTAPTTTIKDDVAGGGQQQGPGGGSVGGPGGVNVGGPAAAQTAQPAPGGSLPITGGDVAGLAILGAAAVGAGAVLVRRTRTTA